MEPSFVDIQLPLLMRDAGVLQGAIQQGCDKREAERALARLDAWWGTIQQTAWELGISLDQYPYRFWVESVSQSLDGSRQAIDAMPTGFWRAARALLVTLAGKVLRALGRMLGVPRLANFLTPAVQQYLLSASR